MRDEHVRAIAGRARDRMELAIALIGELGARNVMEVGVFEGAFAKAVLDRCPDVERYTMLDPWRFLPDWNKPANEVDLGEAYEKAMAATEFAADRREVLRGRTIEMAGRVPDGSLDFLYIDGDHTLRGITVDLVALYPKVRPGGLILGDDFVPSVWQHDNRYEPTLVFPMAVYFAEAMAAPIYATGHRQFLIVKPVGEEAFAFADLTGEYGRMGLRESLARPKRPFHKRLLRRLRRSLGQG